MLGAIYIGLSGMNAYSKGLQTISNNVANMNSPGFKASSVNFADVFGFHGLGSAYSGGGSQGAGVRFGTPSIDFTQGDMRQSGGDLDLAVKGNGFLVLSDGNRTAYARTGQFSVDKDGYIALLGGDYRLNVLDAEGRPTAVNIDDHRTSPPVATTAVKLGGNLDSGATSAITVTDIAVFDSSGKRHVWTAEFTPPTGGVGDWTVTVKDSAHNTVGTSTFRFLSGGVLVDPSTSSFTINHAPAGADPLEVKFDLSQGVTAYSGSIDPLKVKESDGNAMGAIETVKINSDGQVELTYTNKKTKTLGAVALANFRDPQSLQRIGDGLFRNEGAAPRLLASGDAAVGDLVAGQIEGSNVDLAQQFGDLILIQRGFQASSQVVSVSNDMIQQLFGIRGQG